MSDRSESRANAEDLSQEKLPPRNEDELRKEVVHWYARLCSGAASESDRLAWQAWYQGHPDHRRAWQRIENMRGKMQQVPSRIALPVLQETRPRRQALRSIALFATAGTAAYISYRAAGLSSLPLLADYRTRTGEQRTITLDDGAQITMNTGSAINVEYTAQHRLIRLRSGEILVETAHGLGRETSGADPRPFVVVTEQASIRALGTRFTVRQKEGVTEVAVLADAVEVKVSAATGELTVMRAGEAASFSNTAVKDRGLLEDTEPAWMNGSIVATDWRLGDLIAEIDRYRPGRLMCNAAVAELRISGAFPVFDTDKALAVIAKSLPVKLTRMTRFWVSVGPA